MLFTPIVLKNLMKKPATRLYPFKVREPFPNYRGELVIDIDKCIFCGMCSRKCPSQCIDVDKTRGTWQCDPHACVYCGVCVDVCPTKCLGMKDVHRAPVTEKVTWIEHGTPPKPRKKAAAPKAETPAEAEEQAPQAESEAAAPKAEKKPAAKTKKKAAPKKDGKKS